MNSKGGNLETYLSPEYTPRDGDKMLADPLLNKGFLYPLNGQKTNKDPKKQEERLGFRYRRVG